jgi:hypothetical protein
LEILKDATIPIQIRYVHYFESILKNKILHPISHYSISIRSIKVYIIPKVGIKKFVPNFTIENQKRIVKYSDINKKRNYTVTNYDLPILEFPLHVRGQAVCGDVKFYFIKLYISKSEKLFKFLFNTNFLSANGIYKIKKEAIDKACKEEFKIVIYYI